LFTRIVERDEHEEEKRRRVPLLIVGLSIGVASVHSSVLCESEPSTDEARDTDVWPVNDIERTSRDIARFGQQQLLATELPVPVPDRILFSSVRRAARDESEICWPKESRR
jgi:hypothetical protein